MKKIDRLKWIGAHYGSEFVTPYIVCRNRNEILGAIHRFESSGHTWGLRTDTPEGQTQATHCPFLFKGTTDEAKRIWNENGRQLYYIVCENIFEYVCHGVAEPFDAEHIYIEFNDKEPFISLRGMWEHPKNLRHIVVGPSGYVIKGHVPIRCFHPEDASYFRFDRLYELMLSGTADEDRVEFSVSDKRRLVIW